MGASLIGSLELPYERPVLKERQRGRGMNEHPLSKLHRRRQRQCNVGCSYLLHLSASRAGDYAPQGDPRLVELGLKVKGNDLYQKDARRGWVLPRGNFLLWIIIGSIVGWFVDLPSSHKPSEGQECGPGYRWTRIGPADPDLSCEKE